MLTNQGPIWQDVTPVETPARRQHSHPAAPVRRVALEEVHEMLAPSPSSAPPYGPGTLRRTGFCVEVDQLDDTVVLRLQGELDTATSRELRAALATAMAGDASAMVLDLAALSFIDSTGIAVLLAACHQAESQGRSFSLRHPGRMVLKVLNLTGVDRLLSVDSALTG